MDLKFTFGGNQPHEHSDTAAGGGIPLPFAGQVSSASSVLRMVVTGDDTAVTATALSGDGVNYGSSTVDVADPSVEALARAVRSSVARAGAELNGPMLQSIIELTLDFTDPTRAPAVLTVFGLSPAAAQVDEVLQTRTGLPAGIPVTIAATSAASPSLEP